MSVGEKQTVLFGWSFHILMNTGYIVAKFTYFISIRLGIQAGD